MESALDALAGGRPVLTVDDICHTGSEVVLLAHHATTRSMSRVITLGSGFVCVTVDPACATRLGLPPMTWESRTWDTEAPSYAGRMCVAVDAVEGTTTGISARDRCTTVRTIADPSARPTSLTRPGHVIPVLVDDADADVRDRVQILSRAGTLGAHRSLSGTSSPLVFASLTSRIHPCQVASAEEALAWGMPVLRYSHLAGISVDHFLNAR
ncbi:3,4-dihydroxy-2-butanone-4-phosphate synthase [Gordonia sp. (in: high G+C Gram-positive bacteria)]|uniref:3,4-dihydroxy-2-butanone-4-phosphate synthase n=1 Tax=Gordonia sp. (in: high G+C Gram-positive bacteria) TaxID=84139 RepID=UPI003F95D331